MTTMFLVFFFQLFKSLFEYYEKKTNTYSYINYHSKPFHMIAYTNVTDSVACIYKAKMSCIRNSNKIVCTPCFNHKAN